MRVCRVEGGCLGFSFRAVSLLAWKFLVVAVKVSQVLFIFLILCDSQRIIIFVIFILHVFLTYCLRVSMLSCSFPHVLARKRVLNETSAQTPREF